MIDDQIVSDAKTRILSGDWDGAARVMKNAGGSEASKIAQIMCGIPAPDEGATTWVLELLDEL